jgi:hypothetical protein
MASLFEDPDHWLSRAEEARAIADEMQDRRSRRIMLAIAVGYDGLAERAAARKKLKPLNSL